jgi:hypothetical protein
MGILRVNYSGWENGDRQEVSGCVLDHEDQVICLRDVRPAPNPAEHPNSIGLFYDRS